MSGFDVLMKSQQMMQQTNLSYDKMRYDMNARAGQAIAQTPANFLAAKKAASDMRIQEQQAALANDMGKINMSNALEQGKQVKIATQQAQLAFDAAKDEFQRRDQSRATEITRDKRDANIKRLPELQKRGMTLSEDGLRIRKMTGEELRAYNQKGSVARENLNLRRVHEARLAIQALYKKGAGADGEFRANKLSPAEQQQLKQLEAFVYQADYAGSGAASFTPGAPAPAATEAGEPAADPATTQPPEAPATTQPAPTDLQSVLQREPESVQQQFQVVANALSGETASGVVRSMTPEQAGKFMLGVARVAGQQVDMGVLTGEYAGQYVVDQFFNGTNSQLQAFVMGAAGLGDDAIKAYLGSRPHMQKLPEDQRRKTIESVIKQMRADVPAPQTASQPSESTTLEGAPLSPRPGEPGYITGVSPGVAEQFGGMPSGFGNYQGPSDAEATGQPQGAAAAPPDAAMPGQPTAETRAMPVVDDAGLLPDADIDIDRELQPGPKEPPKSVSETLRSMEDSSAATMPAIGRLKKRNEARTKEQKRQVLLSDRLEQDVARVLASLQQKLDRARKAQGGPVTPQVSKQLSEEAEAEIAKLEQAYMKASKRGDQK